MLKVRGPLRSLFVAFIPNMSQLSLYTICIHIHTISIYIILYHIAYTIIYLLYVISNSELICIISKLIPSSAGFCSKPPGGDLELHGTRSRETRTVGDPSSPWNGTGRPKARFGTRKDGQIGPLKTSRSSGLYESVIKFHHTQICCLFLRKGLLPGPKLPIVCIFSWFIL